MLEPRDRRLFLEALRPPPGAALECAVGTTFSLDLLSLLAVPLAFTLFDLEDESGRPTADPLVLLEALRRHAGHVYLFCQAGQIAVPPHNRPLYTYLEGSVIEVALRQPAGVFHPKVWILRFRQPPEAVVYRLLVLSRNLTFDRCWDTMLVLDGCLTARKNAFGKNEGLGDFVEALPSLALRPLPARAEEELKRIEHEVRRVEFELPPGFEDLNFHPLGLQRKRSWPFAGRIDRLLVISPFVSPGCLNRLTTEGAGHHLVSRPDSLAQLDKSCRDRFSTLQVLNEAASPVPSDDDLPDQSDVACLSPPGAEGEAGLLGLHAKTYVADAGWNARIWTGSANATDAAFNGNVEFLVELGGKKSHCGIDAVLARPDDGIGLADLLQDFVETAVEQPDPVREQLEMRVESARRALSKLKWEARVDAPAGNDECVLSLHLLDDWPLLPEEVSVHSWPATMPEAAAKCLPSSPVALGPVATFERVSLVALTSFFAFAVTASKAGQELTVRFVINAPLRGAPANRGDALLRSLLKDRSQVIRYLLLLLAESEDQTGDPARWAFRLFGGSDGSRPMDQMIPLLEPMVRALHRNPTSLDSVARLIADLCKTREGRELLPEGLEAAWEPIWHARRRLKP